MEKNLDRVLDANDMNIKSAFSGEERKRKTHKCDQCHYSSNNIGHLRSHLKMHSGEKGHKCDQCDYASFEVGHLRSHLKVHSGEKKKECNQCNFSTAYAQSFKNHVKKHKGEKQINAACVIIPPFMRRV